MAKRTITRERLIKAITHFAPALDALQKVKEAAERTLQVSDEEFVTEQSRSGCHAFHDVWKCISDKRAAAKKGKLMVVSEPSNCLLATAWSKPFMAISVDCGSVSWFPSAKSKGVYASTQQEVHPYEDVVCWYDTFTDNKEAAKAVLSLINNEVQKYQAVGVN